MKKTETNHTINNKAFILFPLLFMLLSLTQCIQPKEQLILRNSPEEVRDSMLVLKGFLKKLSTSKRESTGYYIDKVRVSAYYNHLFFNEHRMGKIDFLEKDSMLIKLLVEETLIEDWKKWVSDDITPFDTLTYNESMRFLKLVKYLDLNKITSASYNKQKDFMEPFTYNDSLRLHGNGGFRDLLIDTAGVDDMKYYKVLDERGGIMLVKDRY